MFRAHMEYKRSDGCLKFHREALTRLAEFSNHPLLKLGATTLVWTKFAYISIVIICGVNVAYIDNVDRYSCEHVTCKLSNTFCPCVRPGASRQFIAGGPSRTRTNRKKNSSAFIHSWQWYRPDPVWGKKWSRTFPVHSRCSPEGATMCPGAPRYATALSRASATEPLCCTTDSHGSRTSKAPVLHGSI